MDVIRIKVPKNFKAVRLNLDYRPKTFREFLRLLWGVDIFFGEVPFLKTILILNILVWSLK